MNDKLKNGSLYAVKNAVNALLVAYLPVPVLTGAALLNVNFGVVYNWRHILVTGVSAMISREAMIWLPRLYKWSQTNGV